MPPLAVGLFAGQTAPDGIAIGTGAVATGSVAIGNAASAGGGGTALGDGFLGDGRRIGLWQQRCGHDRDQYSARGRASTASAAASSAVGDGATAAFARSAAFGAGATTTLANQQVFGTSAETYTMPGLTSGESLSAAVRSARTGHHRRRRQSGVRRRRDLQADR